ncbi:MAG: hypothetical protein LBM77_09630 [Spirochaetaceae bacterium]|jgi:hypothetical protein|nr:hypothetical protein [Spirochaetaceae bacterium]
MKISREKEFVSKFKQMNEGGKEYIDYYAFALANVKKEALIDICKKICHHKRNSNCKNCIFNTKHCKK